MSDVLVAHCVACQGLGRVPSPGGRRRCSVCDGAGVLYGIDHHFPRWRRVRPGLYEGFAATRFERNGREFTAGVRLWVREIPEWPAGMRWAVESWYLTGDPDYPEEQLSRADDGPCATRREATASQAANLESGWFWHPSLGWCVRPE